MSCKRTAIGLAVAMLWLGGVLTADDEPAAVLPAPADPQSAEATEVLPPAYVEWLRPLDQIDVSNPVTPGRMPPDGSEELFSQMAEDGAEVTRPDWPQQVLTWVPSAMVHQPLYFDDVPLERYGQTRHPLFQPLVSGARFFGTFPVMPYKIGVDHPYDLISTLGYYRPGSPAPCVHQTVPFEWDAATLEAAVWTGFVFLLP
jgi:hypothetical protein